MFPAHSIVQCSAPHSAACMVQSMPSSAAAAVPCTGLDLLFQSEERYTAFPMSLFSELYHHEHNTNNYKHLTSCSVSILKHPGKRGWLASLTIGAAGRSTSIQTLPALSCVTEHLLMMPVLLIWLWKLQCN